MAHFKMVTFLRVAFFFLMWTSFKIFIEICSNIASALCFGFLIARHVGSQLPNQGLNWPPCTGRRSPNRQTTREVPLMVIFKLWELHISIMF